MIFTTSCHRDSPIIMDLSHLMSKKNILPFCHLFYLLSITISLTAQSPTNNECANAIPLTIGECTGANVYDNSNATRSTSPDFLCGWSGDGRDVWFSVDVPSSGNLTVEINQVEGSSIGTRVIMEVHAGSCANLSPLACNYHKERLHENIPFPKIEMTGLTPNETMLIRVTGWDNNEGQFQICATDAFGSYPCRIDLITLGTQGACDPTTNTYEQEFVVHHRYDASAERLRIMDETFDLGASPQTVVLSLPATGSYLDIWAAIESNAWNECRTNSEFYNGGGVNSPSNCYAGTVVNDEPCDAIFLSANEGCVPYIGNNTGATHSMGNGVNYNFECNWAGPSPMDVWYRFEVPASGDVIIHTYETSVGMNALYEVYTGSCDALTYIGGCAGDNNASLRYDGLSNGQMLYVRVAAAGGNSQGDFGICIIEPKPMSNDICQDAIDIAVSNTCEGDIYSMHTTTPSNDPTPVQSCEEQSHNASRDIWFRATVPDDGIIYIATEKIEKGHADLVMSVYHGVCNDLIEVECQHANRALGHVSVALYGRPAGEVLYIRVSQWGSWEEDRNYTSFRMCATSSSAPESASFYHSDCYADRHNSSMDAAWLSCEQSASPNPDRSASHWVLFDLEVTRSLELLQIWNINHPDFLNSGAKRIAIDYKLPDDTWQELGQYDISKANASGYYEGEVIDMQQAMASDQFLITILENFDDGFCSGLAEMRLGFAPNSITVEDCVNPIELINAIDDVEEGEHWIYRAADSISGNIMIYKGGQLELDAAQGVLLNPAFEVSSQSILEIYLEGCTQQKGTTKSPDPFLQYVGAGITEGYTLSVSSSATDSPASNLIDGTGMDADYMAASRFLAQSTLGFGESEVEQVLAIGVEAWIDQQMQTTPTLYLDRTLAAFEYHRQLFLDNTPNPSDTDLFAISEANTWRDFYNVWWPTHEDNQDLLHQRVALALSEIFVISTNIDAIADEATGVADYYDMLLEHSFGNFRDLLEEVTLHACMGFYLSHLNNPKSDLQNNIFPDENYAREIMQLFSIGLYELNADGTNKLDGQGQLIPTYNNGHIKELAKVFTGLGGSAFGRRFIDEAEANGQTLPDTPPFGAYDLYALAGDAPMIMFDEWHEPGAKTIVGDQIIPDGQTGMQDINMALDILFYHENVGPFIGKQLIQRLVKSNPSPAYIERITTVFNDNGSGVRGDLGAVVKAILLDEEARSCMLADDPYNGKLREPIIKYLHMTRSLGKDPTANPHIQYYSIDLESNTKQQPMRAPNVFNFFLPSYSPVGSITEAGLVAPEFQIYDAQTAIGNANLFHGAAIWGNTFYQGQRYEGDDDWENKQVRLDFSKLLQFENDDEGLINFLDRIFTHGRLSDRTRNIIREAIRPMHDWNPMYHNRESMALYLILNSPDYNILK